MKKLMILVTVILLLTGCTAESNERTESRETVDQQTPVPILGLSSSTQPQIIEPNTIEPNTIEPNTIEPNTIEPNTIEPHTIQPHTIQPHNSTQPAPLEQGASKYSCKLVLDSDLLRYAAEGQLPGIEVALHSPSEELEEIYGGAPDFIGYEHLNMYQQFDDCFFYIWNEKEIGVMDIRINYSVKEVLEILGEPAGEGYDRSGFNDYSLTYTAGENALFFSYGNEDSTKGVLRFKNPN